MRPEQGDGPPNRAAPEGVSLPVYRPPAMKLPARSHMPARAM